MPLPMRMRRCTWWGSMRQAYKAATTMRCCTWSTTPRAQGRCLQSVRLPVLGCQEPSAVPDPLQRKLPAAHGAACLLACVHFPMHGLIPPPCSGPWPLTRCSMINLLRCPSLCGTLTKPHSGWYAARWWPLWHACGAAISAACCARTAAPQWPQACAEVRLPSPPHPEPDPAGRARSPRCPRARWR